MPNQTFATVTLISGMNFRGKNPDGLGVEIDLPSAGNNQAGATPMELILQAMGGCTGLDVVSILRKRDPEIFEILLKGDRQETHPKMYKQIELIYRCKAKGLSLEMFEKAVALSMNNYCAISNAFKATAEIKWECELIQ